MLCITTFDWLIRQNYSADFVVVVYVRHQSFDACDAEFLVEVVEEVHLDSADLFLYLRPLMVVVANLDLGFANLGFSEVSPEPNHLPILLDP